ncbi:MULTISPECIES: hypothetical protein [unclassified Pseudomonas]|uniref:hypothetical protein n=1 Tax=unclassified Pseudomonas TaxID=196821 RepID=UPI000730E787|nr:MULTISPECIES: hypothetical protein [unclassified Pseudomonas]KSW22763.1 hypothetical protein AOX63_04915 [Pseudomonas sp. ADP]OBP09709.1 hypothetical protein BAE52_17780 [Pseudomonas sp. EGD-AKN5]QOF85583.1 hypothetical protein IG194_02395 [Pseudomonas sp. ADPe]
MQPISTGTPAAGCVPINPQTGTPYFTISQDGWGTGWAAGSAVPLTEADLGQQVNAGASEAAAHPRAPS